MSFHEPELIGRVDQAKRIHHRAKRKKKSSYYFIDGGSVLAGLVPPYNACAVHRSCGVLAETIPAAFHEPELNGRVDQAERIHHRAKRKKTLRIISLMVDPSLRDLIHPTTAARFVVRGQRWQRQYRQLSMNLIGAVVYSLTCVCGSNSAPGAWCVGSIGATDSGSSQ
jgi:hypothetical protein